MIAGWGIVVNAGPVDDNLRVGVQSDAGGYSPQVMSAGSPRPKNADFLLLKVERPCCVAEESACSKRKS
jgi:hypothetical protein